MTEHEQQMFRLVIAFYDKWRSVIIETDEQWNEFAQDLKQLEAKLTPPLGYHLMDAVVDTINDLYRNGMKPVQENYFGRDDL